LFYSHEKIKQVNQSFVRVLLNLGTGLVIPTFFLAVVCIFPFVHRAKRSEKSLRKEIPAFLPATPPCDNGQLRGPRGRAAGGVRTANERRQKSRFVPLFVLFRLLHLSFFLLIFLSYFHFHISFFVLLFRKKQL